MRSFATLSILLVASLGAIAAPLNAPGNPLGTAEGTAKPVEQMVGGKLPVRQLPAVGGVLQEVKGALGGPLPVRQLPDLSAATGPVSGLIHARQLPDLSEVTKPVSGLAGKLPVRQLPGFTDIVGGLGGKLPIREVGADAVTDKVSPEKVDAVLAKAEKEVPRGVAAIKAGASTPKANGKADVAARGVPSTHSVVLIVESTWSKITPLAQKLQYVNKANATTESIEPVITEIQKHLTRATTDMKALVALKLDAAVLLKGPDGVAISVAAFAKVVACGIILLTNALVALVAVLGPNAKSAVMPLIYTLGDCVYEFIAVQFVLVAGLGPQVNPLVFGLAAKLSSIGFVKLSALLGL